MANLKHLFSPIKIGTMEVKNRIAMAPMGTGLGAPDGTLTEPIIDYYEARAKGGVGLIITGITGADRRAWEDKHVASWKKATDAVHAYGAKLIPQLIHPGPLNPVNPVAPSPIPNPITKLIPRELTIGEIEGIVEEFGEAARRVREAGCDGLELHMAHGGYLLVGGFTSPLLNRRSDAYGGSFEARLKFPLEIIAEMRTKAGADFPIVVRLSGDDLVPEGRTIEETLYMVRILVEAGIHAIEVSSGVYPALAWRIIPPMGTAPAWNAPYSAAIKEVVDVPVMVVGRINNPLIAEHILETGKADLVSMGRALLADPEWPNKAAAGNFDDITPCIACTYGCLGRALGGLPVSCTLNPTVGREKEMAITPAARPKKVLVAGGGPGGLEAARVAALRGHQVTLFDRAEKLGGQFNIAAMPPCKQELTLATKYLSTQVEKAGVKVELSREVTPALVEEHKPDVMIVATGGAPLIPDNIPGVNKDTVVTAWDVLAGKVAVGRNLVIIGGGMVGCETAEFLADPGDCLYTGGRTAVTIIEMLENVAMDVAVEERMLLLQRLRAKEVRIITSAEVKEIIDDGVVIVRHGQEEAIQGMDRVILAMGTRSVDELSQRIRDEVAEVYVIGDAKEPRKALEAIHEGAEIGRKI